MTGVAASRANTTGSPDYIGREVHLSFIIHIYDKDKKTKK